MGWKPQLNTVCSRCGKKHGVFALCVSSRPGPARVRLKLSYGNCPDCKKAYGPGGPLTHTCARKSDFGRRRKQHEEEQRKRERAAKAKNRPAHPDPRDCRDDGCQRRACALWKEALALGEERGREAAEEAAREQMQAVWRQAYSRGRDECPREHK
jgi:hypothetical protein